MWIFSSFYKGHTKWGIAEQSPCWVTERSDAARKRFSTKQLIFSVETQSVPGKSSEQYESSWDLHEQHLYWKTYSLNKLSITTHWELTLSLYRTRFLTENLAHGRYRFVLQFVLLHKGAWAFRSREDDPNWFCDLSVAQQWDIGKVGVRAYRLEAWTWL